MKNNLNIKWSDLINNLTHIQHMIIQLIKSAERINNGEDYEYLGLMLNKVNKLNKEIHMYWFEEMKKNEK